MCIGQQDFSCSPVFHADAIKSMGTFIGEENDLSVDDRPQNGSAVEYKRILLQRMEHFQKIHVLTYARNAFCGIITRKGGSL